MGSDQCGAAVQMSKVLDQSEAASRAARATLGKKRAHYEAKEVLEKAAVAQQAKVHPHWELQAILQEQADMAAASTAPDKWPVDLILEAQVWSIPASNRTSCRTSCRIHGPPGKSTPSGMFWCSGLSSGECACLQASVCKVASFSSRAMRPAVRHVGISLPRLQSQPGLEPAAGLETQLSVE